MKTVFIYALKDPDTGQIRYIGMSGNPEDRLRRHLRDMEKNHRTNWIQNLRLANMCPVLAILDEVSESERSQWEVAYIAYFRECGYDLVNGNAGGEGGHNPTKETCAKISAANAGKKRSLEFRAKISAATAGENNPNFGKKMSPETRAKIGVANTGKKQSLEARAKKSAANTGKKHSPEAYAKHSAASKLYWEKKRQAEILAEMWD